MGEGCAVAGPAVVQDPRRTALSVLGLRSNAVCRRISDVGKQ